MEHQIKTGNAQELIDITNIIQDEVRRNQIKEGIAVVFVPHTTAGITINENADPDVIYDILTGLNKVFPELNGYRHAEGNSHAHIKSSLFGSSVTVIIENGKLKLGTWQGVYFCEFDGPRTRKIYISFIKN
ncbi:secondary thiamine-phosphate synthase enzyme YjbQ [Dehalobacterium formicoaceticum]|uniref:Secondary thiamine-phosphate synthase enzyme YjbQ n=1 Tax=Dehalobacterium formicoaceticum TaxID=51515 RepID=A0ABT1Y5B8_9FIRM|nr:secondary thiamine-phosphate synthase enzyme YjbQ [Dehalobacterium formicoaceticum]MCR6544886.1 secondary thiamine-phosphate synthase enzyme YjbQ [Dehalobacterium formicoaceticum]